MYISPFWCGVIATILVEIGLIVLFSIKETIKNKNK